MIAADVNNLRQRVNDKITTDKLKTDSINLPSSELTGKLNKIL